MAHARRRWHIGGADTWEEATRVHTDTGEGLHMARGWRVKGPRVSGPLLECWGGNAKALPHYTFYSHDLRIFSPCGTMDLSPCDLLQDTCVKKS